jgi:basic amino acid/polyamine antiporter, APA family
MTAFSSDKPDRRGWLARTRQVADLPGCTFMLRGIFRTKNLDEILAVAEAQQHKLRRSLGPLHVTLLGIGAIIGAGIFATIGSAAAGDPVEMRPGAGPSLMLSFAMTAVVCAFTALCYAEFASMVPIAGSAYTYSYATLGELVAWIIGWDLIIEYAVGNVAVAISWANYFRTFLAGFNIDVPFWLAMDYRTAKGLGCLADAPHLFGMPIVVNLLGFGIVALLTIVLVWGIRESAGFNAGMVCVKIVVLLFFVVMAFYYVSPSNMVQHWQPFQPTGWKGTFAAAATIFFAYIGFDAVSTVAEETKKPSRDLPIGIIASLIICTFLYVVVAAVFTGLLPYDELVKKLTTEKAEPLTMALDYAAPHQKWATTIVAFGSVVAHTAVLLVFQLGQPRIFYSMARDGLLPATFARVHPRFKTPHVTTILTGVMVGGVAAIANIDEMVALTNIGTLFAFVLVCAGIIVLRFKDPNRLRPFRVPFGPFLIPILGMASCLFLMYYLPPASWWRFVGWLILGLSIYTFYGYCHSTLGRRSGRAAQTPVAVKFAASGFLAVAVGLFTIPHNANIGRLVMLATTAAEPDHHRAMVGFILIAAGLVLGLGGWLVGAAQGTKNP